MTTPRRGRAFSTTLSSLRTTSWTRTLALCKIWTVNQAAALVDFPSALSSVACSDVTLVYGDDKCSNQCSPPSSPLPYSSVLGHQGAFLLLFSIDKVTIFILNKVSLQTETYINIERWPIQTFDCWTRYFWVSSYCTKVQWWGIEIYSCIAKSEYILSVMIC